MNECNSILAREFWRQGKLVTPCCCIFFGFSNGEWSKAFFNDEFYSWEFTASSEQPVMSEVGDLEFSYPYKEYLPLNLVSCGPLVSQALNGSTELVLAFSKLSVTLTYDAKKEIESIEINT